MKSAQTRGSTGGARLCEPQRVQTFLHVLLGVGHTNPSEELRLAEPRSGAFVPGARCALAAMFLLLTACQQSGTSTELQNQGITFKTAKPAPEDFDAWDF